MLPEKVESVETALANTHSRVDGCEAKFATAEQEFMKDDELMQEFEKRVMAGDNLQLTPKDLYPFLGNSMKKVE